MNRMAPQGNTGVITMNERRYDIDWLRVIAIFLLIFYHTAIMFQPWANQFGFIQSQDYLPNLWVAMEGLNIWRIPLLFFVSGMGLYFSMRSRTLKALLKERGIRIGIPLLFGSLTVVPFYIFLVLKFYYQDLAYYPNPGHLWFLLNIVLYILLLAWPLYKLSSYLTEERLAQLSKWRGNPLIIYVLLSPLIIEAILVDPEYYSLFAMTSHGFFVGLCAFFTGFVFVTLGKPLWQTLLKLRFWHVSVAVLLYVLRMYGGSISIITAVESVAWLLAAFGFAYRYLRFNNSVLAYLNQAVFPVYIIHMAVLYGIAYYAVYWELSATWLFLIVFSVTLAGSFLFYEIVRRMKWMRPLFGMKL